MDPTVALVGLAVGTVVGLTSLGGGALLTPALVLVSGLPPSLAVGSDVLAAAGMKVVGGGAYALRRAVHWPTVGRLAAGSVPGATLGLAVLARLPRETADALVGRGLGAALILAGAAIVLRLALKDRAPAPRDPGWPLLTGTGLAVGFLVSLTSIGSGSLLMAVLALVSPLPAATLVGTDLAHAVILSLVATAGHALGGRVDAAVSGTLLLGAVPGVLLGARMAWSVPERSLRAGLAALLVLTGLYLGVVRPLTPAHRPAVTEVRK